MSERKDKPWYKKTYVWILVVIGVLIVAGITGGDTSKTSKSNQAETTKSSAPAKETSKPAQEPAKPKWDAAAFYDQIQAGMTKGQVEQIIGKASNSCSQTAIQGYGTTEYCIYSGGFGDKGSIGVNYQDGVVNTKSKIDF